MTETTTTSTSWKRIAEGDYETTDGRYRMWRLPDVTPPAWNVEDTTDNGLMVNGAATMRDAKAILADVLSEEVAPITATSVTLTVCGPNLKDQSKGQFHVHTADCGDLKHYGKRGSKYGGEQTFDVEAEALEDVVFDVYPPEQFDYDPETDFDGYLMDFHFAPCVPTLPERRTTANTANTTTEEDSTTTNEQELIDKLRAPHKYTPEQQHEIEDELAAVRARPTVTAIRHADKPWHFENGEQGRAMCGKRIDNAHERETDVDHGTIRLSGVAVCGSCIAAAFRKFTLSNPTTQEVIMSAAAPAAAPAKTVAKPDPKIKANGQQRPTRSSGKPAARKPAARKAVSKTVTAKGETADLVKALTTAVKAKISGVKAESSGLRVYYRISVDGKAKTLGYGRASDRKAQYVVGSEARQELTTAAISKAVEKMAKRAEQLRK